MYKTCSDLLYCSLDHSVYKMSSIESSGVVGLLLKALLNLTGIYGQQTQQEFEV